MSEPTLLRLRFSGNNLSTDDVHASDLAEMIRLWAAFITSSIEGDSPALKEDVRISLAYVREGSIDLGAYTTYAEQVQPAYRRLLDTARNGRYDLLTNAQRDALTGFIRFDRKYRCSSDLYDSTDLVVPILQLDANVEIPPPAVLTGTTTIYGVVNHAGGKIPNVHVETLSGESVRCSGTRPQIQELAARLYEMVGIEGEAKWNSSSLEIVDFKILRVLPYRDTPIDEAMEALRAAVGSAYDDVDPVALMRELREDDA